MPSRIRSPAGFSKACSLDPLCAVVESDHPESLGSAVGPVTLSSCTSRRRRLVEWNGTEQVGLTLGSRLDSSSLAYGAALLAEGGEAMQGQWESRVVFLRAVFCRKACRCRRCVQRTSFARLVHVKGWTSTFMFGRGALPAARRTPSSQNCYTARRFRPCVGHVTLRFESIRPYNRLPSPGGVLRTPAESVCPPRPSSENTVLNTYPRSRPLPDSACCLLRPEQTAPNSHGGGPRNG